MNKQELIDELTKYVKRYENVMDEYSQGRYGAYKVSLKLVKRLNEPNITDEQAWNKVAEAYPESAQSLRNTLDNVVFRKVDEPQKPVVPKFVEDWFEENKDYLDNNVWQYVYDWEDQDHANKFFEWFANCDKPIETLIRMKDGYEVEKEQLYYVKLPVPNRNVVGLYLGFNREGEFDHSYGKPHVTWGWKYTFTEAEIKAIDERYWPFAVPAEEVAEG